MNKKSRSILFGDAYKHFSAPKSFNIMAKPIGPKCNLNCTYCYYLEKEKLYPQTRNFKLQENILEQFVKSYINEQDSNQITFVWQGGESTMLGINYFKRVIKLQRKYANGKTIENAFQTNGTFITDDWCHFFRENNFLVGISIDGPENINDHYRKNKAGAPTFYNIMKGIDLLHKHNVPFNTLSTVNDFSSQYPEEVYHFLKSIGSGFMQFIPIVERAAIQNEKLKLVDPSYSGEAQVTNWSVRPQQYGKFLISIFDKWVRHDVAQYYVQLFDVTLANWLGEPPGLCVFDETCGMAAVMEHNGDVYSCDHYVYKDFYVGNIMNTSLGEIMASQKQTNFGIAKRNSLPQYCLRCNYRFACHGECPKHRFCKTPNGEPGLNYLCEGYKMFFSHVTPYMNFMANELKNRRAPANVMQWLRNKRDNKNL